jgi:TolB-like protein/Flp pilus assembly protein TadD
MSFWVELKRRNVYRVGVAYAVVGWMLAQVTSVFVPALNLPGWIVSLVALIVIVGFPVALGLAWVYELTPEGIRRTTDVPTEASVTRITARKLNFFIIGALALALLFFVVDDYVLRERPAVPSATSTAATSPTAEASVLPNSVAVLPFVNMSPNPDDAYFAEGVHEEVLNQLAKISSMNVIARASVLRYADGKTEIPEIARELHVKTVMEGSVRYAGDSVRITAQLIDPATGAHLWSEAYQRKLDDIFAIQADIAMNIANALRAEFSLEEQKAIEKPLTTSSEAYALYLQARALGFTPGGDQVSESLLRRAIGLDPNFAEAYGELAAIFATRLTNTTLSDAARPENAAQVEKQFRDYANRALALDPQELVARGALAGWDMQRWYWSNVAKFTPDELAKVTGPAVIWAQAWMGNTAEILADVRRWATLDPKSAGVFLNLGVIEAYAGNREASNRAFSQALENDPANALSQIWLAYNAAAVGDAETALRELRLTERLIGDNPPVVYLPELAYTYARIGRADDARRVFDRLGAAAKTQNVGAGAMALGYLAIGDEDRALTYLEEVAKKAVNHEPDAGYVNVMNLKMNFLADPRIATGRFAEVLARIKGS